MIGYVLVTWLLLLVGFVVGWVLRFRTMTAAKTVLDRRLLVAISHLLEDAESALSSIEGTGVHRQVQQHFTRAKAGVTMAQPMVRNLLGIEQPRWQAESVMQAVALPNGGAWIGPVNTAASHGPGCACVICAARTLDFPGADRHSL